MMVRKSVKKVAYGCVCRVWCMLGVEMYKKHWSQEWLQDFGRATEK